MRFDSALARTVEQSTTKPMLRSRVFIQGFKPAAAEKLQTDLIRGERFERLEDLIFGREGWRFAVPDKLRGTQGEIAGEDFRVRGSDFGIFRSRNMRRAKPWRSRFFRS